MGKIILYKNAFLIDGLSDRPIEDGLVIIDGDEIAYAGGFDEDIIKQYRNPEVVDVKGMTLMPGLIDTHVHLSLDGSPTYFERIIMDPPALTAIKAVPKVKSILESGFTTIRTMGDKSQIDIAVKRAIESGDIVGPRLLASGNCITITGGHGDMFPNHVTLEGMGRIVDGPIEARKAAREQIKAGADHIKLMATGGGMSPGPGTVAQLTVDEMKAAVEEAEKNEKITGAHAIGAAGIVNALHAGIRTIEHGTFLDEEGISLMLDNDAYLVPTLAAFKTLKYGKTGGVPEYTIEKVRYFKTVHTKNLRKAIQAGVPVIVGTDAGTPFNFHGQSAYELERLVDCGLTEMQAIQSATKLAAEAMRLPRVGVLKIGNLADLIIVDGNPLDDVRILQEKEKIKSVVKEGISIGEKPEG